MSFKKLILASIIFLPLVFICNYAHAESDYPVEITYPQGREKFISGQEVTVSWRNIVDPSFIKEISFGYANSHSSGYMGISATKDEIAARSYKWTVPDDANGDTVFKLLVSYVDGNGGYYNKAVNSNIFDVSQNMSISFSSPKDNTVVTAGGEISVVYTVSSNGARLIPSISLYKGDKMVANDVYINGSNGYIAPEEFGTGSDYRIKIVIGSAEAFSDYFTINVPENKTPEVIIDFPASGNTLKVGNYYSVKWHTSAPANYSYVEIWLDAGPFVDENADNALAVLPVTPFIWGQTILNIAPDIKNIGSYNWQVPAQYHLISSYDGVVLSLYPYLNPKDTSINIRAWSADTVDGKKYVDAPVVLNGKYRLFLRLYGNKEVGYKNTTGYSDYFTISPNSENIAPAPVSVKTPVVSKQPVSNSQSNNEIVPVVSKKNDVSVKKIDLNLSKRLGGKILLQVESAGAAWYVDPGTNKRYSLGRPEEAFLVMRQRGVGITNADLNKIPVAIDSLASFNPDQDSDHDGYSDKSELQGGYNPNGSGKASLSSAFATKQKGKILLQVQAKGEAWYVNPDNNKRYYLGRPADAFNVMRKLGLGIANSNIAKIEASDKQSVPVAADNSSDQAGKSTVSTVSSAESTTCAVTDKCVKYRGVEIAWSMANRDSSRFNPSGIADQPTKDVSGTDLSADKVDASLAVIKKALDKYPLEVLKKFVYKIYVLDRVVNEKNINIAGMSDPWNVKLFVAFNPNLDRFEQSIHHEIAHNITKSLHYTVNFNREDLDRLNIGGLSYDEKIGDEVIAADSNYTSEDLWKSGFLTYYCRTNEYEDFSEMAGEMFKIDKSNTLRDLWNTVELYPILKSKIGYVINFYKNNIDPIFTEDYFHRISAE